MLYFLKFIHSEHTMPTLDLDALKQLKDAIETLRLASYDHQEKTERLSQQHMMNARFPFTAFENTHIYRNGALAYVRTSEITVLGFDVNPDNAYATGPTGLFQTGSGDEQEKFRGDPSFYYPTRADAERDAAVEMARSRRKVAQSLVDQYLPEILPVLIELAEKALQNEVHQPAKPRMGR